MSKRPRKRLSPRELERVEAKRQAHLAKRREAEDRAWWKREIAPIFERAQGEWGEARSFPPPKPPSGWADYQEKP